MSNLLRTKITQGLIIINLNFLTILSLTRTIVEAMDLRLRTTINKDREINVFKESTNKSTQIDREIVKWVIMLENQAEELIQEVEIQDAEVLVELKITKKIHMKKMITTMSLPKIKEVVEMVVEINKEMIILMESMLAWIQLIVIIKWLKETQHLIGTTEKWTNQEIKIWGIIWNEKS